MNTSETVYEEPGEQDIMRPETNMVSSIIIFSACTGLPILFGIICGVIRFMRRGDETRESGYSVAVSNRLFNDCSDKNDLPCLNCRLIEMGSMACYQDKCPQCGRTPPNQQHLYP
eukprot:TRINITY_DN46173_c0_g1_i1.p1 TRINITY_DN46173_c0_g1~~TRINITY_DN46173_c0_g1_i1.p1  ORF type:complete len:115 (+),score=2.67 TRINITY_DN46173_c0_g1_i1:55-399(+)